MPLTLHVAQPLRLFLPVRHRDGHVSVTHDGTSSLGHVVQAVGIPLTEVGRMTVHGVPRAASFRPHDGHAVQVEPVTRPQALPAAGARFILDVHLGSLARRMRLLGLDTAYSTNASDDALVAAALADDRLLLTKDRGLLRRKAVVRQAAYVRGAHADDQLADVLDRFDVPLRPLTRCATCNGLLRRVPKSAVLDRLEPGTARSFDEFAACEACGRAYWEGAHADRLRGIVEEARTAGRLSVSSRSATPPGAPRRSGA